MEPSGVLYGGELEESSLKTQVFSLGALYLYEAYIAIVKMHNICLVQFKVDFHVLSRLSWPPSSARKFSLCFQVCFDFAIDYGSNSLRKNLLRKSTYSVRMW